MLNQYCEVKKLAVMPRLPLEGKFDLTYHCNNNCRHCWLRLPASLKETSEELSFQEVIGIIDEARNMGCRSWSISGGEPMIRDDFPEILDYVSSRGNKYSLNTNGTLITPKIAKLMKRKGVKMVALYGATKEVHDQITRNPGSFEATMRGMVYLKEYGAGFIVQLIPLQDNLHQFEEMKRLAQSLSENYRIGIGWLYFSAFADQEINREIQAQRIHPRQMVEISPPYISDTPRESLSVEESVPCRQDAPGYFFSGCIKIRREFHIDPFGKMSFCNFIRDPAMRYDLRQGTFADCWDNFIPSLAKRTKYTREFLDSCGACRIKEDCPACPAYNFLEHGDFSKKIDYLCALAQEKNNFRRQWQENNRRFYSLAGITIRVDSDLPLREDTFREHFRSFETNAADAADKDTVSIRHHFYLPKMEKEKLGDLYYRKTPWEIYKKNGSWIYSSAISEKSSERLLQVAVFNAEHSRAEIYHHSADIFLRGNLTALTLLPTDELMLARLLAERQGCYFHASGVSLKGKGLLFIGHSGEGKSTMVKLLSSKAEVLCDDKIILRNTSEGFKIFGTWLHGEIPDVSPKGAPLAAIIFLKKSKQNRLIPLANKIDIFSRLAARLIRPLLTDDWWEKELQLLQQASNQTRCYEAEFDQSGGIVPALESL